MKDTVGKPKLFWHYWPEYSRHLEDREMEELIEAIRSLQACYFNKDLTGFDNVLVGLHDRVWDKYKEHLPSIYLFGARKYAPLSFEDVHAVEYIHALSRHAAKILYSDEAIDVESGQPHMTHILANIDMFMRCNNNHKIFKQLDK